MGDRGDGGLGIGPQAFPQVFDQLPPHLLIGQAKLGVLVGADAVDFAEPFRVVLEILLGRDEPIGGVDEAFVDLAPAVDVIAPGRDAVGLVAGRPDRLDGREPERLPIFERWFEADVEAVEGEAALRGHERSRLRPPAAPDDVFEERIDGIEGAARAAAGQDEVIARCSDNDFLRGQGRRFQGRRGQTGRASSDEQAATRARGVRCRREIAAGDDVEKEAELGGRRPFRFSRVGGQNDPGHGFAFRCQDDFARGRRDEEAKAQDRQEGDC